MTGSGTITATFELEPHGSAAALAVEESTGLPGWDGGGLVAGRVVDEGGGRAVIEFPVSNWGRDLTMLVAALVAGEAVETRAFTRCRLVGLDVPAGLFPGPAVGAQEGVSVGVIVKPSLGLAPREVAAVADEAARGGAALVKDDELLGDPEWCRVEDRVRAVADVLHPSVVYCVNVSGGGGWDSGVVERARRAVELGATGVMINPFAQGLGALLALRDAGFGVPILAHRVGSGPWVRNERYGVVGHVLTRLLRLAGADIVLAGAYGGKLFDTDDEVDAHVRAARETLAGDVRRSTAALGGGIGPANAVEQAARAGGDGLVLLLGSAAYAPERGGLGAAVRSTVESLSADRR